MLISIRVRKSWYNLIDVNHAQVFKRIEGRVNGINFLLPISDSFMFLLCPAIVEVSQVLNSLQLTIRGPLFTLEVNFQQPYLGQFCYAFDMHYLYV